MKLNVPYLCISLAACSLLGCQESAPSQHVVGAQQAVIGSNIPDTDEFPFVAAIEVTPPPPEMGNEEPQPYFCAGTLIGATTVVTSARCVTRNVTENLTNQIVVHFGDNFSSGTNYEIAEVVMYRYFDEENSTTDSLALLRLTTSPMDEGIMPIAFADEALDAGLDGMPISLVGYGIHTDGSSADGVRYAIETPITTIEADYLFAGTMEQTTCAGDTGAPVLLTGDDGPTLLAVTSSQSSCNHQVRRVRVDRFAADFLLPYLARFDNTCPQDDTCDTAGCTYPDPDCDPCAWNGVCEEECPTRDWDCAIGKSLGQACAQSGECERGGTCTPAVDDEAFLFCTQSCVVGAAEGCPAGMECQDLEGAGQCVFLAPSPGSQGAACVAGTECRSEICEDSICVNECTDTCAAPYECRPSDEAPGKNVCRGEDLSGGGGFCAASNTPSAQLSWLSLALFLIGFGMLRAHRRSA